MSRPRKFIILSLIAIPIAVYGIAYFSLASCLPEVLDANPKNKGIVRVISATYAPFTSECKLLLNPLDLGETPLVSSEIVSDRTVGGGYGYQFRQYMNLGGHDSAIDISQQRTLGPYNNRIRTGSPFTTYLTTRLHVDTIDFQTGSLRYTSLPHAENFSDDKAWWKERFAPFSETLTSKPFQTSVGVRYIDTGHWAFQASPDKNLSVNKNSETLFVIDGVETEIYYHASELALLPDGTWAFRYQDVDRETCDATADANCPGSWFIKTSNETYGPYDYRTSEPIPTSAGDFYYYTGEAVSLTSEDKTYTLYKNGEEVSVWDYIDNVSYTTDATDIVFRARRGDEWFIVKNGTEVSKAWAYVDQLSASRTTDTFVYSARDEEDNWHLVKNEATLLLLSEPDRVYLNELADEPFAFFMTLKEERPLPHSGGFAITQAISSLGDWSYSKPVRLEAVDADGNMLFMSREELPIYVRSDKTSVKVQDFMNWSEDKTYWMNNTQIGTGHFRLYPTYKKVPRTSNELPEDVTGLILGGVLQGMYFDEQGHAVFFSTLNGELRRNVYDVSEYRLK